MLLLHIFWKSTEYLDQNMVNKKQKQAITHIEANA